MMGEGKEFEVKEGYVFFVGYDTEVELVAEDGLEAHIAYAEV
jgi:mannose-6-phosphate isomerase